MVRVAINGFGRIGRQVFQAGYNDPDIEWVGVNDLTDTKTLAHLLKYDSVYGKLPHKVEYENGAIIIDGNKIPVHSKKDPSQLPWKDVDVVIECTGRFTARDKAALHLQAGAKKVLISAPGKNPDVTIVKGVNEHEYDKDKHNIISNASCTTNAIAQLVKVLNDNFVIKRGFMFTAHSYTSTQNLVDGPHKDLRRARAAAANIVPTSTGAAKAVADVIPSLKGKIDGLAWRVPILCGSIVELTCEVEKPVNVEKINWLFKEVSKNHLKGVLEYSEEALVSRDIIKNPHSCVFDALSTRVIESMVVISGWYDNEWGYSNRIIDMIKLL